MKQELGSGNARARNARRPVHGVLLLDKPLGLTSNAALQRAKWLLRAEKAGHTGTLDPLASGVLPLCFGAATKFSQGQLDADKSYEAVARLGVTTSTGDAEGEVLLQRALRVSDADLQRVTRQFSGAIEQTPPMYSALKKDGKALYAYARAGQTVERAARSLVIRELRLAFDPLQPDGTAIRISVTCSKGTYVRTLAEDIGEALGCGAHLITLRRSASGPFDLSGCLTLEALESMPEEQCLQCLLPLESLLARHEALTLDGAEAARFLTGLRRRGPWPDQDSVAVYGPAPMPGPACLLGTAHIKAGELIPTRLLSPREIEQILESKP